VNVANADERFAMAIEAVEQRNEVEEHERRNLVLDDDR